MRRRCLSIVGPLLVGVLWFGVSHARLVNPIILPPPEAVLASLGRTMGSMAFYGDLFSTVYRWVVGLCLGLLIGVPLGIVLGYFDSLRQACEILVDFFRSLPSITLYPLFLIAFGLGDSPKIAIVVYATSLYMVVSTVSGVSYARHARLLMAKAFRASTLTTFRRIIFPSALPQVFAGARISVTIGLIVTIGSEMVLGAKRGLGRSVLDASNTFSTAEMYGLILVIGFLGYISSRLFAALEIRVVHWRGQ